MNCDDTPCINDGFRYFNGTILLLFIETYLSL